MPVERNEPDARVPIHPADTSDARDESLAVGTEGGTLRQELPPAWAIGDAASVRSATDARSGREISALDRELAASQASGMEVAEGYTLVRKLGTGAFGAVWEAENRLTHERVAIKFFTAGDADWASLLGEVGLLQTVEGCRGIVLVKEVRPGGPGHRPHYVMQLANAGSLADWLKEAGSLPPRERVRTAAGFFTRVARAMAAVHRRGIHHCDLKPHNVLLHCPEPGAPPEPLVADFGQAHFATDDTPALGTFFYMPPDQIEAAQAGTPSDTRWDVYALGAIAYEMLTGEPPRRTPELVERIKKSPKNLAAKTAVYREGILAAPAPEAHHTIADPALARIIDRCLSLDPAERPADAGALVALLDGRARWRRTRPVLALAAAATLLLVLLMGAAGALAANSVQRESEENVTTELASSLARTAGYSVPVLERRLQFNVRRVEATAEKVPAPVKKALADLGRVPRGAAMDPAGVPLEDRKAFAGWLEQIVAERKSVGLSADGIASVALVLASDSGEPGLSRGFLVARGHADGTTEYFGNTQRPQVYGRDFSFRDYFHGRGSLVGEETRPHAVNRATHICNPYHSYGSDRTSAGETVERPWKVDIVTPVWDGDRVVGLLSFGLNLERNIVEVLEPADLGARGSERFGIADRVKVVLVDDRDQWVWHPDARDKLAAARPGHRLPHDYAELARKYGRDPDEALPWRRMAEVKAVGKGGRKFPYAESGSYVDLVEAERDTDPDLKPEIACFTAFHPYAESKYDEARGRRWVLVAQVDRETALNPLKDLRGKIVNIGAAIGTVLALVAAGLWAGLVVVLRRQEFAPNG